MKITAKLIEKYNPCFDRIENFRVKYPNWSGGIVEFLSLDDITYSDKLWVGTRLMSQKQKFHFALACAESVYELFNVKCPNNLAVRTLLDYLATINDPATLTIEQLRHMRSLRAAAYAAAYAATAYAAAYAAYAAAYAAAAYATAYAAAAAAAAADAAAYAAAADVAAAFAAREVQQETNLLIIAYILTEET